MNDSDTQPGTLMVSDPSTESVANSTLAVIAQAAANPDVDADKMTQLLELQERILAKDAEAACNRDLFTFKEVCPQLKKGRAIVVQGRTRSQYCSYEDMMKQIRPLMTEYGFAERFDTSSNPNGEITAVTCIIVHRNGHSFSSTFPVVSETSGSKNDVQAIGSALSYGKRYSFAAAMGIVFTDEDDDGGHHTAEAPKLESTRSPRPPADSRVDEARTAITEFLADHDFSDAEMNQALSALFQADIADWKTFSPAKITKIATGEKLETIRKEIESA